MSGPVHPPVFALGIDPGLGESHFALVGLPAGAYPPVLIASGAWATPEDAPIAPFPARLPTPTVMIVECARGSVIKGRDADPVLRNATMSGRLQEAVRLAYPGVPVASAPAFGTHTGWNWRAEVGANGMTDAGIRAHLQLIFGQSFPLGVRGGKASHIPDAAGLALAACTRIHRHAPEGRTPAAVLAALTALSPLETAVKDGAATRKTARRQGRALQKRYA